MKNGTLVLVRHGESRLNELNIFTGWIDVSLSKKGLVEARKVASHCHHFDYDAAFTSSLERARETLQVILSSQKKIGIFKHATDFRYNHREKAPKEFTKKILPIFTSEKLNERSYGDLQGLNKDVASRIFGKAKVFKWRRKYKNRPPKGESLEDVYLRVIPYFEKYIHPIIKRGRTALVVAHGNSLRALIKYLERVGDDQIPFVYLPTGHPLVYSCAKGQIARVEGRYHFRRPLPSSP